MRHNPRKGLQQREPGQRGGAGPSDPNLLSRLEEYAQNHQLSDIDGALGYLQRNYPEYKRKQVVPFRKYLALQIPAVRRRMSAAQREGDEIRGGPRRAIVNPPEEVRLREREDAHVVNMHGVGDMNEDLAFEGSDNSSENSDGVESDDTSNSDAEGDDGAGPSGLGNGDIAGPSAGEFQCYRGEESSASSQGQSGIIIVGCTLQSHHIIAVEICSHAIDQTHWKLITYLTRSLVLVSCGIRLLILWIPVCLDILTLGGISSFISRTVWNNSCVYKLNALKPHPVVVEFSLHAVDQMQ
jgi:hypothetical protein